MGASHVTPARAVLCEHLSPAQLEEFEYTRTFTVRGRWGRRYKIFATGRVVGPGFWWKVRFGIWTDAGKSLPDEDRMLAMKLLLEADERYFRKTACWLDQDNV